MWDVISDIASTSNHRSLSGEFNACSRNQEMSTRLKYPSQTLSDSSIKALLLIRYQSDPIYFMIEHP